MPKSTSSKKRKSNTKEDSQLRTPEHSTPHSQGKSKSSKSNRSKSKEAPGSSRSKKKNSTAEDSPFSTGAGSHGSKERSVPGEVEARIRKEKKQDKNSSLEGDDSGKQDKHSSLEGDDSATLESINAGTRHQEMMKQKHEADLKKKIIREWVAKDFYPNVSFRGVVCLLDKSNNFCPPTQAKFIREPDREMLYYTKKTDPRQVSFCRRALAGCHMLQADEKEAKEWWKFAKRVIQKKVNACRNDSNMNMKWEFLGK